MVYRELTSLTNDEIRFIVNDIFHPKKITNIKRYKKTNCITCDITTTWDGDEGEDDIEIVDEVELKTPSFIEKGIHVDFSLASDDYLKWKQYCLAKGCFAYIKDNPYLEIEE